MKLIVLCPGQAAQRPGMLDAMLTASDLAELRDIASDVLGENVVDWWRRLDERALFLNANAQFAIAFYQLAVWSRIVGAVPKPIAVAGYSLGEVLAWHVAGAIDAHTTLRLVRRRAALMDEAAPSSGGQPCLLLWRGRVLAAPAMRQGREALLAKYRLHLAIQRPAGDAVFGGTADDVAAFLRELGGTGAQSGIDITPLNISIPSHTGLLRNAVDPFRRVLAENVGHDPDVPVLAGIDGRLCRSRHDAPDVLAQQIAMPIRWDWCQETLLSTGFDAALELGPGNDLSRLLAAASGRSACRSIDEFTSVESLRAWLQRQASADA